MPLNFFCNGSCTKRLAKTFLEANFDIWGDSWWRWINSEKRCPSWSTDLNIQRPITHPWPQGVVRFTYRSIVASSPALWSSRWSKISSHSSFFWVCDQINFDEQFLGIFFGHFLGLPQNYEARSELRKRCTIGHAGFPTLLKSWEKGTFLTGFADPNLRLKRVDKSDGYLRRLRT